VNKIQAKIQAQREQQKSTKQSTEKHKLPEKRGATWAAGATQVLIIKRQCIAVQALKTKLSSENLRQMD